MKTIALEEAYISPYFEKYCKIDGLLEYYTLTGQNKDNYNYLLDPDNRRFNQADKKNVTFVISTTVPGAQDLKDMNDAPIFCKLTNDYFRHKVDTYNKIHNTYHSFFGILPFNNVESAINELKRLNNFSPPVNRVLFNGPTANNNNYDWLEGKKWNKLWEYANKHRTILYAHPFVAKSYSETLPDPHMETYIFKHPQIIGSQFGFHVNGALFFLKLHMHNIFDNYPNIQWIAGHMGELLLWYLWRFDHRTNIYRNEVKNLKQLGKNSNSSHFMKFPKKTLTELFKTSKGKKHAQIVSTTSGWFSTPALNFAIDVAGIDNVLFSIDTPYENFDMAMEWFNKLPLSDSKKCKLGWKNANDILSIFPKKYTNKTKKRKTREHSKTKKRKKSH